MIVVRLFAAARAAAGVSETSIEASTLGELKEVLVRDFPKLEPVLVKCSFLVNEVSTRDDAATLSSGDTVDVLPPFAGGSL